MITKLQLQNKLLELAKKGAANGNLGTSLAEYLTFVKNNYNDLDSEAKVMAEKAIDIATEGAGEAIGAMPDGILLSKATQSLH